MGIGGVGDCSCGLSERELHASLQVIGRWVDFSQTSVSTFAPPPSHATFALA